MNVRIVPGKLTGAVKGISSKSVLHRMLLMAALSDRATSIKFTGLCDDVQASIRVIEALGADVTPTEGGVVITPTQKNRNMIKEPVSCGESGSTLRFFLPIAAALTSQVTVTGEGRLPNRPLKEMINCLCSHGKVIDSETLPLTMKGKLQGGRFVIPGNISSQYVSGLLMMAPLLNEEIIIECSTKVQSEPYVDMTCSVMKCFGVPVIKNENNYRVLAETTYRSPGEVMVEGDWSNAAFFLVANALGQDITIPGLFQETSQGDAIITDIIKQIKGQSYREVDVSQVPDLVIPLAVLAAATPGVTRFVHAQRLRLKESDRIQSTVKMIRGLGGCAEETPDGLRIEGSGLTGGIVHSQQDHRIVMAAAIASCVCSEPVVIMQAEAVTKSYPHFFEELKQIGGNLTWEN